MGKKQQKKDQHKKAAAAEPVDEGKGADRRKGSAKQQRRRAAKEHPWAVDDLERELAAVGLRIKTIDADGNCFFRSVLDQLEGEGGDHLGLRCRVMDYIQERQEEYQFFIEDDEPFDQYIKRMKKEGAWAGHLELQATSMLLQRNLCVYQSGQPVWQIKNHPEGTPVLHISYHDQIHYNSVRNSNDYGSGPPESLRMGGASSSGVAAADPKAVAAGACAFGAREVDQVVAGTGCSDRERIARVLEQCCGSIDQAIELLIEQLGQEGEEEEAAAGAAGAVAAAAAAASGQQQGELQQDVAAPAGEKQQQQQHQPAATQPAGAAGRATDAQEQRQCGDDCIRLELRKHPEDLHRITARLLATGASPAILQQQQPAAAAPGEQQRLEQEQQQPTAAAEEEAAADPEQAGEQKGGKRAGSSRKGVKLKGDKVAAHPARNQRCPCGSTRKYKNCCLHGAKQQEAAGAAAAADASGAAAQLQVLYI